MQEYVITLTEPLGTELVYGLSADDTLEGIGLVQTSPVFENGISGAPFLLGQTYRFFYRDLSEDFDLERSRVVTVREIEEAGTGDLFTRAALATLLAALSPGAPGTTGDNLVSVGPAGMGLFSPSTLATFLAGQPLLGATLGLTEVVYEPNPEEVAVWRAVTEGGITTRQLRRISLSDFAALLGAVPASGGSAGHYTHAQTTPSATWVVDHDLGYRPAGIVVEDSAGNQWLPSVAYPSVNQTVLTYGGSSFSGIAYLS